MRLVQACRARAQERKIVASLEELLSFRNSKPNQLEQCGADVYVVCVDRKIVHG